MKQLLPIGALAMLCCAATPQYQPIPETTPEIRANQAKAQAALDAVFSNSPSPYVQVAPSHSKPVLAPAKIVRQAKARSHSRILVVATAGLAALIAIIFLEIRYQNKKARKAFIPVPKPTPHVEPPASGLVVLPPIAPPVDNKHVEPGCEQFSEPMKNEPLPPLPLG